MPAHFISAQTPAVRFVDSVPGIMAAVSAALATARASVGDGTPHQAALAVALATAPNGELSLVDDMLTAAEQVASPPSEPMHKTPSARDLESVRRNLGNGYEDSDDDGGEAAGTTTNTTTGTAAAAAAAAADDDDDGLENVQQHVVLWQALESCSPRLCKLGYEATRWLNVEQFTYAANDIEPAAGAGGPSTRHVQAWLDYAENIKVEITPEQVVSLTDLWPARSGSPSRETLQRWERRRQRTADMFGWDESTWAESYVAKVSLNAEAAAVVRERHLEILHALLNADMASEMFNAEAVPDTWERLVDMDMDELCDLAARVGLALPRGEVSARHESVLAERQGVRSLEIASDLSTVRRRVKGHKVWPSATTSTQ